LSGGIDHRGCGTDILLLQHIAVHTADDDHTGTLQIPRIQPDNLVASFFQRSLHIAQPLFNCDKSHCSPP
jgi:hypothetical protein